MNGKRKKRRKTKTKEQKKVKKKTQNFEGKIFLKLLKKYR